MSTAAQNIHVFRRKSPLHKEHFFEWLKTAISSNACGTSTLKSLLPQGAYAPHVHPRLRKRLARCTLDCGFKTSESPALRGFVGERAPIRGTSLYLVLKSNGPHRSKNLPVKFGFTLKTVSANIAKKLPPQRCFKPLFIASFNFSHKRRNVRFKGLRRVHTRLCSKDRTQRHTRRNRWRFGWGWYHYPRSVPHVSETLRGRGGKTANFAAFGAWSGVLPKNAESLRDSDALMRVAVPRRRGPAGLRDLFATW